MSRRNLYKFLSFLFVMALFVPCLGILSENRNVELIALMENRTIAPKPTAIVFSGNFFHQFEDWYNDRLLGRKDLIRIWSKINGKLFNTLISREIVQGKEGFLFYPFFLNYDFVDEKEKLDTLKKINSICNANNAKFTVFITPPSEWVYPEFLPVKYKAVDVKALEKKTADIFDKNKIDYCFIGKRFLEISLSERESLYYKGDYHWNAKGGHMGAKWLLNHLQLDNTINKEIEYKQQKGSAEVYTRKIGWDPIVSIVNVPHNEAFNYDFNVKSIIAGEIHDGFLKGANQKGEVIYENKKAYNNVRVLILGDSFWDAMKNYFLQDVRTVIYSHNCDIQSPKKSIDIEKMIKEYKPDIVVYEKLGSYFYGHNYDAVFDNINISGKHRVYNRM